MRIVTFKNLHFIVHLKLDAIAIGRGTYGQHCVLNIHTEISFCLNSKENPTELASYSSKSIDYQ